MLGITLRMRPRQRFPIVRLFYVEFNELAIFDDGDAGLALANVYDNFFGHRSGWRVPGRAPVGMERSGGSLKTLGNRGQEENADRPSG